jgi:hypothetical protein
MPRDFDLGSLVAGFGMLPKVTKDFEPALGVGDFAPVGSGLWLRT